MSKAQPQSIEEAIVSARSGQTRFWLIAVSWLLVMGLMSFYFLTVIGEFEATQARLEEEQETMLAQLSKVHSLESRLRARETLIDDLERKRLDDLTGPAARAKARTLARDLNARVPLLDAQRDFLQREIAAATRQPDTAEAQYFLGVQSQLAKRHDEAAAQFQSAGAKLAGSVEAKASEAAHDPTSPGVPLERLVEHQDLLLASLSGAARSLQLSGQHEVAIDVATRLIEKIEKIEAIEAVEASSGVTGDAAADAAAGRQTARVYRASADAALYDPLAEAYAIRAFSRYKNGLALKDEDPKADVSRWYADCEADAVKAARTDPTYWVPRHYLGFAYFLQGRTQEAVEAWHAASRLRMTTLEVAGSLENIGLAYLNNQQWNEAYRNTSFVLMVHPKKKESPWNALIRGIALTRLGRSEEAAVALEAWAIGADEGDVKALKQYLSAELHEFIRL